MPHVSAQYRIFRYCMTMMISVHILLYNIGKTLWSCELSLFCRKQSVWSQWRWFLDPWQWQWPIRWTLRRAVPRSLVVHSLSLIQSERWLSWRTTHFIRWWRRLECLARLSLFSQIHGNENETHTKLNCKSWFHISRSNFGWKCRLLAAS